MNRTKLHTFRDNGLNIGKHALVLFVSVLFSFVVHFAFAYFYENIATSMDFAMPVEVEEEPEKTLPIRLDLMKEILEVAQTQTVEAPDAQKAISAVNDALSNTAIPEVLVQPELPDAPVVPDQVMESALALPNQEISLPPPPALERQEVIALPEIIAETLPEAQWKLDGSFKRTLEAPDFVTPPPEETMPTDAFALPSELFAPIGDAQARTAAVTAEAVATLAKENVSSNIPVAEITESTIIDPLPEASTIALLESTIAETIGNMGLPATDSATPQRFFAIDESLSLSMSLYSTEEDPTHNYYRINIVRRPDSTVDIMPKDVVFIQDISGSIGRRRIEFCKRALLSALYHSLREGDRFTIFAFRDITLTPAASWMTFDSSSKERVERFVNSLRAKGNTDIFSLLAKDLPTLQRDPKRPLIAIIITDGEPTVGETETARIIGEFSRMNQGNIAIYTFNAKRVDPYFLDMLCYSNRGENTSSSGEIKLIEHELQPIFEQIRNPVMKDISLTFDSKSQSEIHPKKLTHLFADRYLTVYGRVPKSTQVVNCQLRGIATDKAFDAIFNFDLNNATKTDLDLRHLWAERAMFDLLAEYAANPSVQLLKEIDTFSKTYGVTNPYQSSTPVTEP